ncbi:MAG: hypothetical protein C0625_02055 [Arcobacter sp.]|nr:MAG: hypothetical protein C0625_02055 [Arcobacter sp.]
MKLKNLFKRAKGSILTNNKKEERTSVKLNSKQKDILTSLFELPVQSSWLDNEAIDKILRDGTVSASIGSRKAATLKKEILIDCKDSTIKSRLEDIFDYDTLDSILDIPYQGFGVFELNWEEDKNRLYPVLVERDYKNFILEKNVLKYFSDGMPEDIPMHKAIYSTYKSKANKPYGQAIYTTLFWLIEFKNASLEFWVELLERFGTPWVIAKTEGNKNELADEIYNMLGGDGAVVDTEDEIDLKTATDKGNFKEIVEYIDDQIRMVLLGGNLTGQVKGGSQAAATVHNEIREDLARADENIVNKVIKEVLKSFKELNQISEDITGTLKDKDDPNKLLVDRDKVIHDMGYTPTKEYIEKTYNINVEDKKEELSLNHISQTNNSLITSNKNIFNDELDKNSDKIDITQIAITFQKQIVDVINNSDSYEEMLDKLFELYPNMNTSTLEDTLFQNIANAQLLAAAQIEDENKDG